MTQTTPAVSLAAPVRPKARGRLAPAAFRPSESGFWGEVQERNRLRTIRAGMQRLESAGNLDNLRLAAGLPPVASGARYVGKMFADSDVYKMLEAVAWELGRQESSELRDWQREVTALVASAQQADGYLNSYTQVEGVERYADLERGHELYCAGHLIQAGVAQARATGDQELLEVGRRFADHLDEQFRPERIDSTDGHPEIETALVELYRETSEQRYLDLAERLIDVRGQGKLHNPVYHSSYLLDDMPVRQTRIMHGHAVRALYLLAGVIDAGVETGDEELLDVAVAQWDDLAATKSYVTGGVGSRWEGESIGDPFELPPDRAYAETCAAIASMQAAWRLALATGEARYGQAIETTLYNAFLVGISEAGTEFFYNNPLQVRSSDHVSNKRQPRLGRQGWFSTACCPPNMMRLLSSLGSYVASMDDRGVQLHQLLSGAFEAGGFAGHVESSLPRSGHVRIEVTSAPERRATLSVRIPDWASHASASLLSGQSIERLSVEAGDWLRLDREWVSGDVVELELPLLPRVVWPSDEIDSLRGTCAIALGPLVLCLDQGFQPERVDIERFRVDPAALGARIRLVELWGGLPAVALSGHVAPTSRPASPYLSEPPRAELHPADVLAIPYFAWGNRDVSTMRVFIPITS